MQKSWIVMDIRIEKTEGAIRDAFMELRAHKPLEKIKVKELCELARINKSTFYAHYQDIYALADALEEDVIQRILSSLSSMNVAEYWEKPDQLNNELFHAFLQYEQVTHVLFDGRGRNRLADRIEEGLRARIDREDPAFGRDPVRCIILSYCVQGAYHTFMNYGGRMDPQLLVETMGEISKAVMGAYRGIALQTQGQGK